MKICKNFYVTFSLRNLMNMKNISYETPLMQPWNANNLYVFNWSQHQVPCQKFWHNQQFETKLHIILKSLPPMLVVSCCCRSSLGQAWVASWMTAEFWCPADLFRQTDALITNKKLKVDNYEFGQDFTKTIEVLTAK